MVTGQAPRDVTMEHLRKQWRALRADGGIEYLILPNDPLAATAALLAHPVQVTDGVYPSFEGEPGWTRDVMRALTLPKDPGFTLGDMAGDAPTSGFMVSIDPRNEESIPLADIRFHPDWVRDYFDRHADILRADSDAYIGAWIYRGQVFLDVSVHTNSADQARDLCLRYKQQAYNDLLTGQTVFVDRRAAMSARAALGIKEAPRIYGRNATALGDLLGAMVRDGAG